MTSRTRSKSGRTKRFPKRSLRGGQNVPPQGSAHEEALTARLSLERSEAFISCMDISGNGDLTKISGERIKALHTLMRESYELMDSMLGELELDPPIACQRGCIHCCYNQVALTEPEALYLGMHLLETRTPEQLKDLTARALTLTEKLNGKSWQEIGMARHRLPCLFLENGNCSIYPARPFACRGWNSVNVNMCELSNITEDAMTPIENHAIIRQIAESIQQGILRGSKALGLEAGYLLMTRATSLLLEAGAEKGLLDYTGEWLQGHPFFARKRSW
ncbi:YkgJ family cysteine cluster protein [Pseudodesulfovibrio sp.]|uniref:YkgJ family cysteine cluster protein n=1 Tax=unclassified Pseudodesulfovibrio TaxID=2661612 RepID=UPI003B0095C9